VLVEHRIDDVDERLVAREQPVAPGEQVAFQPPLAEVFAQHLHHAAAVPHVVVRRERRGFEFAVRDGEDGIEPVGARLVRAEEAEGLRIVAHDVA